MEPVSKAVPMQTFKRLPLYYNLLCSLRKAEGLQRVSSPMIAKRLGLHEVQVKKDLALVSETGGKPRTGFEIGELIDSIGQYLGYYNINDAVLVGAGQLGRALLSYSGFEGYGVRILAAFDVDESIIGLEKGGKPVMSMGSLEKFCRRVNIRMGIITVPAQFAQSACDQLVASGVLAIWNFAPVHLQVPDEVFVHNENMAVSLSLLSQRLAQMGQEDKE